MQYIGALVECADRLDVLGILTKALILAIKILNVIYCSVLSKRQARHMILLHMYAGVQSCHFELDTIYTG